MILLSSGALVGAHMHTVVSTLFKLINIKLVLLIIIMKHISVVTLYFTKEKENQQNKYNENGEFIQRQ